MSQAAGTAGGEGQPDTPVTDFAGEAPNVRVKVMIRPASQAMGSRRFRAVMNESMNLFAHLLEQLIGILLALLTANDRAHVDRFGARMIVYLAKQQVAGIQVLWARLQQEER